jgi:putative transposase
MIGFVFVRLLYRVSVQVFGWLASLTCDDGDTAAELLVLRHEVLCCVARSVGRGCRGRIGRCCRR